MITEELQRFLNDNKQLIENNKFEELYSKYIENHYSSYGLTDILLLADINPLIYMNKVPQSYMSGSKSDSEIIIPNNITTIDVSAFYRCVNLENIKLPNKLEIINDFAFNDCWSLKNLQLPNTLKIMGAGAFSYCNELTEITIPENVDTLSTQLFFGCDKLSKVEIKSKHLKTIADSAFGECGALNILYIPDCDYIGPDVFENSKLRELHLSKNIGKINTNAFRRCSLRLKIYYDGTKEEWDKIPGTSNIKNKVIFNN